MADAMAAFNKMKVAELRDELQSRGLDTSGTKAVLLERLEEALAATAAAAPAPEAAPAAAPPAAKEHVAVPAVASTPAPVAQAASPVAKAEGGAMTEDEKRKLRAERFGIPVVEAAPQGGAELGDDKKRARAARFGLPDVVAEQERKEARAARFGEAAVAAAEKALAGAKREAPAPVVVDPEFEKKKQARLERFGGSPEAAK